MIPADPTADDVETPRKPSTGLKPFAADAEPVRPAVETPRKPSTGLKPADSTGDVVEAIRRDAQKTQHGIETYPERHHSTGSTVVETPRKPSTGLKRFSAADAEKPSLVETPRKPSTGLKQLLGGRGFDDVALSRRPENPARD